MLRDQLLAQPLVGRADCATQHLQLLARNCLEPTESLLQLGRLGLYAAGCVFAERPQRLFHDLRRATCCSETNRWQRQAKAGGEAYGVGPS